MPESAPLVALVGTATEWERRKVGMTQAQDSGAARLAPAVLIAQHPLGAPMQASWYQVSGIECSPTYRVIEREAALLCETQSSVSSG